MIVSVVTVSALGTSISRPTWQIEPNAWQAVPIRQRGSSLHSGNQTKWRDPVMSRIPLLASIDAAPTASRPLLEGVKKMLGSVPNLFRLTANSPAALEGYLGLSGALAKGSLTPQTRERIALAVAEINGCDYCLSAHAYLGMNLAKLDEAEIAANRAGRSADPKADAAVVFAAKLVRERGQVTEG